VTEARTLLTIAGLSLLCATIGGAVASHALTGLDARTLQSFETAVDFQFFQSLGLIAITLIGMRGLGGRVLWVAAWLLVAGTALFCGSIYAVTFGAPRVFIEVAPYGGAALMLAWVVFAASVWQRAR
jgi:uncharacterized membrane protein YgdD (TMEM256/DUF423 family)